MSKLLILDVDPVRSQQIEAFLAKRGESHLLVSSFDEAHQIIAQRACDIFYCNLDSYTQSIEICKNHGVELVLLLTASIESQFQDLNNTGKLNYIVSCAGFDDGTCERAFIVSANKIRQKHIFGVLNYFQDSTRLQLLKVTDSQQRHDLKDTMVKNLKDWGVRSSVVDRMFTVAEELLMNAIYDAPVDKDGNSIYNHLSRKEVVTLLPEHQSEMTIVVADKLAGLSVRDPFGALPSDLIVKYLKTCYEGQAGSLNSEKGGAGRGLHQIVENADVTVFNVHPQNATEVICLFSLEKAGALPPPTFHYFKG